ncbi:HNH endonuclease signature motif containing protein [Methylocapsa polymorpha]|uniref:HNH endonuclease signature motif containing protein n=1 Tax=Methylocapsa polymorpha TaxID=3080828 RepID=A0ABZ0HSH4_9HYPH|nr:HNH endonuclease signature motif containing protein [Methylocapsa sp. RX1]
MLVVYWRSGEEKGYSDLLPSYWFETDGVSPFLRHDVQGPKDWRSQARCSLNVRGNEAYLDYAGEHARYNERTGFDLGTLKLIFTDPSRKCIREVQWRELKDGAEFETRDVECYERSMPVEELGAFSPLNLEDGRKRIEQMVTLRQGQPAFRYALMNAYERRCAITGCTIEEVLEAAHISPYLGDHTNDVTNGLLLRADIHTLFDRGLIKVDRNYRISASDHIRRDYSLPKTITLPRDPKLYPNQEALDLKLREI